MRLIMVKPAAQPASRRRASLRPSSPAALAICCCTIITKQVFTDPDLVGSAIAPAAEEARAREVLPRGRRRRVGEQGEAVGVGAQPEAGQRGAVVAALRVVDGLAAEGLRDDVLAQDVGQRLGQAGVDQVALVGALAEIVLAAAPEQVDADAGVAGQERASRAARSASLDFGSDPALGSLNAARAALGRSLWSLAKRALNCASMARTMSLVPPGVRQSISTSRPSSRRAQAAKPRANSPRMVSLLGVRMTRRAAPAGTTAAAGRNAMGRATSSAGSSRTRAPRRRALAGVLMPAAPRGPRPRPAPAPWRRWRAAGRRPRSRSGSGRRRTASTAWTRPGSSGP